MDQNEARKVIGQCQPEMHLVVDGDSFRLCSNEDGVTESVAYPSLIALAEAIRDGRLEFPRLEATIEWVPVSDRLPDADTLVLVYNPADDSDEVWLGYLDACPERGGATRWFYVSGLPALPGITHWADLPEPPKPAEGPIVEQPLIV